FCACPAVISTSAWSNVVNPGATTFTPYFPGTNPVTSNIPSRFVLAVVAAPRGVVTSTVALATAAPEGSVTCPCNVPVPVDACRAFPAAAATKSAPTHTMQRYIDQNRIPSPDLSLICLWLA